MSGVVSKALKNLNCEGNTYSEMAKLAGVSPSTMCRYALGNREVSDDIIVNLANNGGFDELKLAYLSEKKLDIINVPIMNNIDDNIQTMIFRIISKEIVEAVEAFKNISRLTMNKRTLNNQEMDLLYDYVEQVVDLIPGIKTFLIRLKRVYGLDLQKVDNKECKKFKQRGYVILEQIEKDALQSTLK
ncbi:helix-turn-helix domain-containing protein [Clostridium felsineum]|uniref:helix-turn-helix domain-containing protein n=1 Tax=Clostridium felsineum TaxID=36839 RepID=UPI00214DDF9D|nr:helix-turn-helix transcriptional regulator [Clostridium felsineum]MCR3760298.1 helix-turn-helix domain-containing protein [Clostridium felsineum]